MQHLQSWRTFLLLPLPLLFAACTNSTNQYAQRDSVTAAYINMVDTSGQYDTSEICHKILQAYIANDTAFFNHLKTTINQQTTNCANWDVWNTDIPQAKIEDIDADEVYRFIYSLQGGPAYEVATISKKADSCRLHYFSFISGDKSQVNNTISQYTQNITIADWTELNAKLDDADFWQLKKGYDWRGLDGSDLTVIGYIKPNPARGINGRYNFVHRFMSSTLNDAFLLVYTKLIHKRSKLFF